MTDHCDPHCPFLGCASCAYKGGDALRSEGCFRRAFWRSIHGPIVASVQYGVRPMTPVGSGICLRDR